MSQQHIQNAQTLLQEALAQADASLAPQLQQIQAELEAAQRLGEGQDAEALQAQIATMLKDSGEFISVMVHEIRKPMTSIRGYNDMLGNKAMGELNEMQAQFVQTIRNNILSMEALVADLSDLNKFQTGRHTASPKMDMFKNIAMQLEKDFTEKAEARNITLTFDTPQGLPLLNLDTQRAVQAFSKLLDNAIKYSYENEGEVLVKAEGGDGALHVIIQDNGVGMTDTEQARLGELFFRGDNDLVTNSKGYGMGIPIVFECLKLLNGSIEWESTPSQGTRFMVTLPAMG